MTSPHGSSRRNGERRLRPLAARTRPVDAAAQRRTRQREAVQKLLAESDRFRTVQEIYTALRDRGEQVGLTTIYRILQLLVDAEQVDVLRSETGDGLYRLCGDAHHHHLMCRTCGRVVEVTGPAVEHWAERVAEEHGFTDIGHSLEIVGTCESCAGGVASSSDTDME